MNYTKGEWKVQADGEIICCLGARVAKAYDPEFPEKITAQTRANAHLIAAAPAMYEALKEVSQWLSFNHLNRPGHTGALLSATIDKALARAEGKL